MRLFSQPFSSLDMQYSYLNIVIYFRLITKLCLRHIIYGVEEGHDTKNEVRKDRWIRKRKRKALGGVWRADQVK